MGLRAPHSAYISGLGAREREIIRAHAGRIDAPYNLCVAASTELANDLRDNGISAHLLHCTGLRTSAPEADARWRDLVGPQRLWNHFLVQIDDEVVDLTRRQFFPASAFPYVQSMVSCDAEWDRITLSIVKPRLMPPS